jgi:FAD/FMN-containing dehydrogenase
MFKTIISLLVASSAATVVSTVIPRDYSARPGSRSQRACAQLKADFPNNYVDASNGANYTSKVDFNWSTNCDLPAACFFVPTSTDMVAKGLSIVTKNGAQFAIRNGGHNPNVGFSSTSGGVLFDMSGMKSVSMSPDQTIIYAGSGYTGGGLQKVADSVGRSVVTGIDIAPGITGLTTLGGYTHFSQLHGLPTDNIVNFEVVLGNSTVVNANATHNTGLYRGLRGGGNNFGIVTRLDLRTSPV